MIANAVTAVLPSRYFFLAGCVLVAIVAAIAVMAGHGLAWWLLLPAGALSAVGVVDVTQTRQSIRRNYPILAHLRFFLEYIRPEIRQYFFEPTSEEMPFSREQRSIVYQRAKDELDKRPFGTQLDVYADALRMDQPLDRARAYRQP